MPDFEESNEIIINETRVIRRLTVRNFVHSFFEAFNLEKGLIYTLKRLFTAPGHLVTDFIGAGRYKYIGPFKLLVITTTIALLAMSPDGAFDEAKANFGSDETQDLMMRTLEDLQSFTNLFLWIYIPIVSFFTWRFNDRKKFNYAENLALHTFYFVLSNLFSFLFFLDFAVPIFAIAGVYGALFLFYYIWMYRQFFSKGWLRSVFELIVTYSIGSIFYGLVMACIFVTYTLVFIKS